MKLALDSLNQKLSFSCSNQWTSFLSSLFLFTFFSSLIKAKNSCFDSFFEPKHKIHLKPWEVTNLGVLGSNLARPPRALKHDRALLGSWIFLLSCLCSCCKLAWVVPTLETYINFGIRASSDPCLNPTLPKHKSQTSSHEAPCLKGSYSRSSVNLTSLASKCIFLASTYMI